MSGGPSAMAEFDDLLERDRANALVHGLRQLAVGLVSPRPAPDRVPGRPGRNPPNKNREYAFEGGQWQFGQFALPTA